MIVIVTCIFSLWLLIWMVYIFKPAWLGSLRYPLHITGWANNWSMFVHHKKAHLQGTYNVFYKDFDHENRATDWQLMPKVKWQLISPFIGLEVRKETLIRFFAKKALKGYQADNNPTTFFNLLCQAVLSIDSKSTHQFRKVKIEYYPSGGQETLVIESEILALK